jgi:hypothetical protein
MHEETRRRLLRVAFFLLCLLPTAGVLGWGLYRALPLTKQRLAHQLDQQLGLHAQIGRLSRPRPGQLTLEDVTLHDQESRRALIQFDHLEAQATDQGWRLTVPEATVPQSALSELWQLIKQRLLREDDLAAQVAQLTIRRLSLAHETQPLLLHDVHWARGRLPQVQQSRLFFGLPGSSPAEGVKIELWRDRTTAEPVTRVLLDTGETALPVSLLATWLGHDWPTAARFRGRLPVTSGREGWRAEFVGQLTDLNLRDLSPDWIPHALQGEVTVNVNHSAFDAHGLQSIDGWLNVTQLTAPRPLVEALIQLKLFAPGPVYSRAIEHDVLAVPQLGVSFSLGEMGLVCKGVPDEAGLPIAASSPAGPVLLSEGHVRVNYLICALVPDGVANFYQARARLMKNLPATLPRL